MKWKSVPRMRRALLNAPMSLLRPFNVCLWHGGRSGSTVLGDLLGQHQRVYWAGEVLENYTKKVEQSSTAAAGWQRAGRLIRYGKLVAGARIYGCEMKIWHMKRLGVGAKTVLSFLRNAGFTRHILLERQNYLRIIASGHARVKTGRAHIKTNEARHEAAFGLDPDRIEALIRIYEQFFDEMRDLLRPGYIHLQYEDDIQADPLIAYRKTVDYLGLEPAPVTVRLQRTNPDPLERIVTNYDEIRARLAGTRYEWMTAV